MTTLLKPLEWKSDDCAHPYYIFREKDLFVAELERPDWDDFQIIKVCETLEDAKQACEAHRLKGILEILTPEARAILGL